MHEEGRGEVWGSGTMGGCVRIVGPPDARAGLYFSGYMEMSLIPGEAKVAWSLWDVGC